MATPPQPTTAATIAELVVADLAPLGDVSFEARLDGCALLEDGVAFGHVDRNGVLYMRAEGATLAEQIALGARRHPRLVCWSVPMAVAADSQALRRRAEAAVELAHIAFSFGVDNGDCAAASAIRSGQSRRRWSRLRRALLVA